MNLNRSAMTARRWRSFPLPVDKLKWWSLSNVYMTIIITPTWRYQIDPVRVRRKHSFDGEKLKETQEDSQRTDPSWRMDSRAIDFKCTEQTKTNHS